MHRLYAALLALPLTAAGPNSIEHRVIADDTSVILGTSCNVVAVKGEKGVLLIDDQRPTDYTETRDAIDARYHLPVVEVVDTHWHLDHAGGNEAFAKAGATILAHQAIRARLSEPQYMEAYRRLIPAQAAAAQPGQVFADKLTFRFGAETVRLVHVPAAHTDGDTLVKVEPANVLHMGDVFFNGIYPFIDLSSGGSIQGLIRAVDTALAMSDDKTRIVPGHGEIATRAELAAYRDMLVKVSGNIRRQIAQGHGLGTIVASKPLAAYPMEGDADRLITAIYAGYTMKRI